MIPGAVRSHQIVICLIRISLIIGIISMSGLSFTQSFSVYFCSSGRISGTSSSKFTKVHKWLFKDSSVKNKVRHFGHYFSSPCSLYSRSPPDSSTGAGAGDSATKLCHVFVENSSSTPLPSGRSSSSSCGTSSSVSGTNLQHVQI